MKNILIFMACTVLCCVFSSCSKSGNLGKVDSVNCISYVMPIEDVLDILPYYLDGITTRSFTSDNIKNIFVVRNPYLTRTSSSVSDTLLYVVNLKNEAGYIVMSADKRVPERMLCLSDTGNITENSFEYEGSIYEYNDIDFYDEENDDYLIGGEPEKVESYLLNSIAEYAAKAASINEYETEIDETPYIGTDAPESWCVIENYKRNTIVDVQPLIKTRWGQLSPYNAMVAPNYTGCVINAVAQIMAYEQFPNHCMPFYTKIIWDSLTVRPTVTEEETYRATMVSDLLGAVFSECKAYPIVLFGKNCGTFTFPKNAEKFMTKIGFRNVTRINSYDEELIKKSLYAKHPVFLAGADGYVIGAMQTAHAWLADGYKKVTEDYDLFNNKTGELVSHKHNVLWDHIHCVWGKHSSWITNGVFRDGSVLYSNWKRMITYEL